jgi:hypothetical protein
MIAALGALALVAFGFAFCAWLAERPARTSQTSETNRAGAAATARLLSQGDTP